MNKLTTDTLVGHNLRLRLIDPEDAEYVWMLRTDERYNAHLSKSNNSIHDQRMWILDYKQREVLGLEYYFVVERNDDSRRCGVLRLYNIKEGSFTWGSWILDEHKPAKAAIDSAILVYKFAFEALKMQLSVFDVRLDNKSVISFHQHFGAKIIEVGPVDVIFNLNREQFLSLLPSLERKYFRSPAHSIQT